MPKILINERDNTTAGTSGSYANYDVLIVGYQTEFTGAQKTSINTELTNYDLAVSQGKKPTPLSAEAKMEQTRRKKADSNGVYKFSTQQDFTNTIGLVAPDARNTNFGKEIDANNPITPKTVYHYGNQMAYELLNIGYSIVYKPITTVADLLNADFWEIFKDKASYDFRFIVHGLLTSSDLSDNSDYAETLERYYEVEKAEVVLDDIWRKAQYAAQQTTDATVETRIASQDLYEKTLYELYEEDSMKYLGFIKKSVDVNNDGDFEDIAEDVGDINIPATEIDGVYSSYAEATAGVADEKAALKKRLTVLAAGAVTESDINIANGHIASLAKYFAVNGNDMGSKEIASRGDCIALIELDDRCYINSTSPDKPENLIIEAINKMSTISGDKDKGRYCAMTVPSVVYSLSDYSYLDSDLPLKGRLFGNNKKFPGSFHYLACFMNSIKSGFAEWYAAAGYTRGVAGYTIDYTTVKLGEIAINALEPRKLVDEEDTLQPNFACNVIANFRGSYYLWGNRTAHPLDTSDLVASHFLNIRQLCTTIKKQLYVACRRFTFDPNSDTLWINFVNSIKPTLEVMKADQGIRDYKILKVYTDKKATLKAKIRIIPIEAVEDFDLEVSLEDSFGETSAVTGDIQ